MRRRIDRRLASGTVEVQALVGRNGYGNPRRLANNLDQQRLAMIIAILERRAGLPWARTTFTRRSPAVCGSANRRPIWALRSRLHRRFATLPLTPNLAVFGELGLSGEVRAVNAADRRREAEAQKLGYSQIVSPANARDVAAAIATTLR